MKMTLSKALRWKKRAVEKLHQFETEVQENNSHVEGEEPEVDVTDSLGKRSVWMQHLIALKLQLMKASEPIRHKIFALAEAKSEICFLQRVPVNHGKVRGRFREEAELTYVATVRKAERDQMIQALQDKIDLLQTEIDAFNAETVLEVVVPE